MRVRTPRLARVSGVKRVLLPQIYQVRCHRSLFLLFLNVGCEHRAQGCKIRIPWRNSFQPDQVRAARALDGLPLSDPCWRQYGRKTRAEDLFELRPCQGYALEITREVV